MMSLTSGALQSNTRAASATMTTRFFLQPPVSVPPSGVGNRVRLFAGGWLLVAVVGASACSVPDVDLSGRPCPCVEGFECIGDVCLEVGTAIDATQDADLDASVDSEMEDAEPTDASVDRVVMDVATDTTAPDAFDGGGCPGLLCEDFENDEWMSQAQAEFEGTFSSSSDIKRRGDAAAYFSLPLNGDAGRVAFYEADLSSGESLYVRAWLHIPSAAGAVDVVQVLSGGDRATVAFDRGRIVVTSTVSGQMATQRSTTGAFPDGRWVCLTVRADRTTEIGASIDETNETLLRPVLPLALRRVLVRVGAVGANRNFAAEVRVDDLVISHQPVSCTAEF